MTPPRLFVFCNERFFGGSFAVDQKLLRKPVILLLQRPNRLLCRMK